MTGPFPAIGYKTEQAPRLLCSLRLIGSLIRQLKLKTVSIQQLEFPVPCYNRNFPACMQNPPPNQVALWEGHLPLH